MAVSNTERFKRQSLASLPHITLDLTMPRLAQELRVSPWSNFAKILSVITLIYQKPDITTESSHLSYYSATLSKLI